MERRTFNKTVGFALLGLLSGISWTLTGCALNESNVKSLLNVLITSIQKILAVAAGAPWAAQLSAALAALQTAEATWSAGGPVAIIDDALNTVTAVLAVIPLTAVYSPLVDIVVAGIEAVLAVLPASVALPKLRASVATNQHHGRIVLKTSAWRSPEGEYKHQWNGLCDQIGMPQARM